MFLITTPPTKTVIRSHYQRSKNTYPPLEPLLWPCKRPCRGILFLGEVSVDEILLSGYDNLRENALISVSLFQERISVMKKNMKRILAILGVLLLLGLYASSLVFALLKSPWALDCLKASIGLTIFVPILLWVYGVLFRSMKEHRRDNQNASMGNDDRED
jgi:hypothetical protein